MNLNSIINVFVQKIKIILPFMLASVFIFSQAYGATPLGGTLSEHLALSTENSPYVIETSLVISSGITLTVPAGVVVKSGGPGIYVSGTLNANGAVFTSINEEPDAGDWDGIVFKTGSAGNLDSCTLQYGRYFAISGTAYYGQLVILSDNVTVQNSSIMNGSRSGIYIRNASPDINNNTVSGHKYLSDQNPGGYGIYMIYSASELLNNTVTDNKNAGIYLYDSPDAVVTGNKAYANGTGGNFIHKGIYVYGQSIRAQFTENTGTDMIYVDADTLSSVGTWDAVQPWIIGRSLTIAKSGSLTISKDAIVKSVGAGIIVEGELNASDTVFTSIKDDNAGGDTNADETASAANPGDWTGIFYKSASRGILSGCSILYGRYFDGYYGQLVILSDVTIENSTIKNGSEAGIVVVNASPIISGNTIKDHIYKSPSNSGGHGISLLNSGSIVTGNIISNNNDAGIHVMASPNAKITQNSVYDNGKGGEWYYKGIYLSGDSVDAEISGNTGTELLYLSNGSTLTRERTWDSSHPWVIGWMTIATSGKLTISSNTIVKSSGYWIRVEGELNAAGTVFTCIEDDTARGDTNGDGNKTSPVPGAWSGIAFRPGAAGSLQNCELRYGGEFNFDAKNYSAQLVLLSDYVNITNCFIRNGNRSGIYISNASPGVENNRITGHEYIYPDIIGGHGIYMEGSESAVSGNKIWANAKAGIFLENSPNAAITGNRVSGNGTDRNIAKYKGIYVSENSLDAQISGNAGTELVYLNGGTMLTSHTWDADQLWAGSGTITISPTAILTITGRAVIKGIEFVVKGELNAAGALFTAITDDTQGDTNGDGNSSAPAPGDGKGIIFISGSKGVLDSSAVRYGSQVSADGNTYPGQLVILSENVQIKNSIIQDGSQAGIYVQGVNPVIDGNQVLNNLWGIYSKEASFTVYNHIFADNRDFAVFNESSGQSVDASGNFWGNETGPQHLSNPEGTGDSVSDYVVFDPWTASSLNYLYSLQYAITGLQIVSGVNAPGYIANITGDSRVGLEDVLFILRKVAGLR